MEIAITVNKITIRLTAERWKHITTGHPEISDFYYEILETIENPMAIYKGKNDELIAISNKLMGINKHIVSVYKETDGFGGFVITAFITKIIDYFAKKEIIWKAK